MTKWTYPRENHIRNRQGDINSLAKEALILDESTGMYDIIIPPDIDNHPERWSFIPFLVKEISKHTWLDLEKIRAKISPESLSKLEEKFPWAIETAVGVLLVQKTPQEVVARIPVKNPLDK